MFQMYNGARLDPRAREFLPHGACHDENVGSDTTEKPMKRNSRRSRARKSKQNAIEWKTLQSKTSGATALDEEIKENDTHERPSCILCCDPMSVVSFGSCDHRTACEKCCLRLRICYSNLDCPMCKKELKEIVLAPWREEEPIPPFSVYKVNSSLSSRIVSQLGPGVVLVDKWDKHKGRSRLLNQLLGMVGMSCPMCPIEGARKFKNHRDLLDHVRKSHKNGHLCSICLEEKRVFVRDQEVFASSSAVQRHKKEQHPSCHFCQRKPFYDSDALWHHLIQEHFRCQLCDQEDGTDAWYRNAPELQLHLANEHFACEHEHCRASLIAFTTLEELQRHHIDQHSGRMRRWDQAQSRPLHFDYSFRGRNGVNRNNSAQDSRNYTTEIRGGLEVIDDDLGMLPRQEQDREHFPSLGEGAPSSSSTANETSKHAKLVSHQVRCPCGRRKTNHVVPEGQSVPSLECDGICRLEGRKNQIDDAFGINRSSHISVFNRKKATWSGTLLKAAKEDVERIKEFELLLEEFVKSRAARRQLAPSPKPHRAILHGMAEQYGVPTVSLGNEPNRAVQLFKPTGNAPAPGIPDQLLSAVCTTVSDQEIANLIKAAQGYQLRFTDIAKTVDLHYHLRSYSEPDGYTITWDGEDSATAVFTSKDPWNRAKEGLQGGIRGMFRIDTSWNPI